MKKKISIIILLAIFGLSSAFAQGLFGPKRFTTSYTKDVKIVLADGVNSSQTLEGIIIELKPLIDADYEKPIFNPTFNLNFVDVYHKVFAEQKVLKVNLDYQLSAFYVTITNNTDHILKMKDARLVFIDPNSDEPIMAYDKQTVKDDIANNFPIYQVLS